MTDGDDDVGADEVDELLALLDDLDDLGLEVGVVQDDVELLDLDGGGLRLVELGLLHDAGTDGGHLRAEARADDGGHQVAAEGGTGHLQALVLIVPLGLVHVDGGVLAEELDVLLGVDVQAGAVGGQTGVETGCAAGRQIAADVGRAEEKDLGLVFTDDVADDLGIRVGGVLLETGILADDDLIGAVAGDVVGHAVAVAAKNAADHLGTKVVGQLAGLGNKLKIGGHQLALTLLAKDHYAMESLKISEIIRHIRKLSFH